MQKKQNKTKKKQKKTQQKTKNKKRSGNNSVCLTAGYRRLTILLKKELCQKQHCMLPEKNLFSFREWHFASTSIQLADNFILAILAKRVAHRF